MADSPGKVKSSIATSGKFTPIIDRKKIGYRLSAKSGKKEPEILLPII
jgi:hypothetical protein